MKITSGVPQGSLLRPRLFSIFKNDLPLSLDCNLEMFTDDSTSYITGNSIDTISIQIQKLLDQLHNWDKSNLKFKSPFIGPIKPITLADKPAHQLSIQLILLGVTLDNILSLSPHIELTYLTQTDPFDRSTLNQLPSTTYCISLLDQYQAYFPSSECC